MVWLTIIFVVKLFIKIVINTWLLHNKTMVNFLVLSNSVKNLNNTTFSIQIGNIQVHLKKYIYIVKSYFLFGNISKRETFIQVHLNKLECRGKVNLFQ